MPAPSQDADGLQGEPAVEQVLMLLEKALGIIDQWGDCPEVGARLQYVIDSLEDRCRP